MRTALPKAWKWEGVGLCVSSMLQRAVESEDRVAGLAIAELPFPGT